MADYHILGVNRYGTAAQVVMHFAVPDANNDAGVNYRVALVEMLGGTASAVPGLDAGEQTQLDTGEFCEHSLTFHTHSGESLVQKRARLDARWTVLGASVIAELAIRLSVWGYERIVP
ncbi:hypothetical protein LCGC14_0500560 [marine sediment metagenome]|uniref:Uncharacterized protein n=1 Tax=marine sediment metagenome TaxID=412755 RepID=A0A0F9SMK8_9ZZZZ